MVVDYGRLLTVFFSEASDQLDRLNQCVLDLEQNPADVDLIDEIFRQAHSLKGGASSFGFNAISTLTHELESYLMAIKRGEIAVSPSSVDTLLAALDALRVLIDHEARDEKSEDEEEAEAERKRMHEALLVVERLREAIGGDGEEAGERTEAAEAEFPSAEGREQALKLLEAGRELRSLLVRFAEDMRMASVRAYLLFNNIEKVATIVATQPARDEIDDETFKGVIRLVVALDEDVTEDSLEEACVIDQVEEVVLEDFSKESLEDSAKKVVGEGRGEGPGDFGGERGEGPREEPGGRPGGSPREGQEEGKKHRTVSPEELDERLARLASHLSSGGDRFLRIEIDKVDDLLHLASELTSERNKVHRLFLEIRSILQKRDARLLEELLDKQEQYLEHLRDDIMSIRMVPLRELFQRFPRLVRDLARLMDKQVIFEMKGEATELDKKLVDKLADPLVHLLRNAVDHGIEKPEERRRQGKDPVGRIVLSASHRAHATRIELRDDGRGIDCERVRKKLIDLEVVDKEEAAHLSQEELFAYLFQAGVSTRETATEISGRGVGLDVVKEQVERLNGMVMLSSKVGEGTTFVIDVPLTLAMTNALLVGVREEIYALPVAHVQSTLLDNSASLMTLEGRGRYYNHEERPVPYFDMASLLEVPGEGPEDYPEGLPLVLVTFKDKEAVLAVDRFIGQEELVIKSLSEHYKDVEGVSGASILGDGRVVLILDVPTIIGRRLHLAPTDGRVHG